MATYNERLQANNTSLQNLVGDVNALPEQRPETVVKPLTVVDNGNYTPPAGVDGFSPVTVNVPTGGGDIKTCLVTVVGGRPVPPGIPVKAGDLICSKAEAGQIKLYKKIKEITGTQTLKIPCGTLVYATRPSGNSADFSGAWEGFAFYSSAMKAVPDEPVSDLTIDIS